MHAKLSKQTRPADREDRLFLNRRLENDKWTSNDKAFNSTYTSIDVVRPALRRPGRHTCCQTTGRVSGTDAESPSYAQHRSVVLGRGNRKNHNGMAPSIYFFVTSFADGRDTLSVVRDLTAHTGATQLGPFTPQPARHGYSLVTWYGNRTSTE